MKPPICITGWNKAEVDMRVESMAKRGFKLIRRNAAPTNYGDVTRIKYIAVMQKVEEENELIEGT